MSVKKELTKLDDFDKTYWQRISGDFLHAQNALAQAQMMFAEADKSINGAMKYFIEKYGLPPNCRITPDGEIILPEKAEAEKS